MNSYGIISLRVQSSRFLSSFRCTFSLRRSAYLYPIARKRGWTVMCLLCLRHVWFVTWYGSINSSDMGRLIPQSLQLQTQVMLTSLGWCYKTGEFAKWCVLGSLCFCSQSCGSASIGLLTWQLQSCDWVGVPLGL